MNKAIYAIKPLPWRGQEIIKQNIADVMGIRYVVYSIPNQSKWRLAIYLPLSSQAKLIDVDSEEDGKEKAEEDWHSRLEPCLQKLPEAK